MGPADHPLTELWQRLARGEAVVAGVLSGTSADGIDVGLLRFGPADRATLLAMETRPFPAPLAAELRAALDGRPLRARELAFLSRDLGRAFGQAARAVAEAHGLALDLVGSHGQTVYHHDGNEPAGAATLQLGDGDFVAAEARSMVVSDFRMADLAAGGEGAPLSALLDPELFPALRRPAAVLNLGGIANVTFLADEGAPLAFDTGPANSLLDGLARTLLARPFDEDGAVAATGRPSPALLAELLGHPFFRRPPPKSTGRDTFGADFVAGIVARGRGLDLAPADLLATATALVAESVARAFQDFLPARPRALVVCGGGAFNRTLCAELARRTGLATGSSAEHGVPPEAREAMLFAHLAVRFVHGRPSTEPRVTGAGPGGVLGKLSLPPRPSSTERASGDSRPVPRSQPGDPG